MNCVLDQICILLLRSDADPGRKVETFGGSPNEALSQMRTRTFEAPFAQFDDRPQGRGEWTVRRSAVDVLYGTDPIVGYLAALERPKSVGWFFHFKKFPVKYFSILDATPGRHVHHLARLVAWAALCAQNLAKGEYDERAYFKASDILFQKHASERLAWMPESYGGWRATTMARRNNEGTLPSYSICLISRVYRTLNVQVGIDNLVYAAFDATGPGIWDIRGFDIGLVRTEDTISILLTVLIDII
jgi:hypothetical protein